MQQENNNNITKLSNLSKQKEPICICKRGMKININKYDP